MRWSWAMSALSAPPWGLAHEDRALTSAYAIPGGGRDHPISSCAWCAWTSATPGGVGVGAYPLVRGLMSRPAPCGWAGRPMCLARSIRSRSPIPPPAGGLGIGPARHAPYPLVKALPARLGACDSLVRRCPSSPGYPEIACTGARIVPGQSPGLVSAPVRRGLREGDLRKVGARASGRGRALHSCVEGLGRLSAPLSTLYPCRQGSGLVRTCYCPVQ
jgi:hypothetical protein